MIDKLAIIVPYRDRQDHLDVFIPHMQEFLKDKGIDYTIFIAEQTDNRPFNYGKLCNIVSKEVGKEYTYFAFHDIDMLPMNDECDYTYPESPTHLATNVEAHDNKMPYPQYFGGVNVISREDFENANGYSNEYWGYGFHDLDLLYRLERSGAYLEKFYDINQTYERYDITDVLPYRIENVEIGTDKRNHKINTISLGAESRFYGNINHMTNELINGDFFISFWFKDSKNTEEVKNLFSFEGCDTGVFLSHGKHVLGQIWDKDEIHYEVSHYYKKEKWNNVIFGKNNNGIFMYLNNKLETLKLKENFDLFDYTKHTVKISDTQSDIKISSILTSNTKINEEIVSALFYDGESSFNNLKNKFGFNICSIYDFKTFYKNRLLLDKGKNLNHLKLEGPFDVEEITLDVTTPIYLPIRLQGEYKSLVHEDDTEIIKKYYKYNPDIEENADIFFHEVLTDKLDYTTIGLSSLTYKILDKQDKEDYELIRIVT
jgi:hypothetical protein